jgi:hypothetical protein
MPTGNGLTACGQFFGHGFPLARGSGYDCLMKKWLLLGLLGLAVAWGPYLYVQLTREPVTGSDARRLAPFAEQDEQGEPNEEPALEGEELAEGTEATPAAPEQASDQAEKTGEPAVEGTATPAATAVAPVEPVAEAPAGPGAEAEGQAEGEEEVVVPQLSPALVPAFRKTFDSEPRDAFWAADEEPRLSRLFQSSGVPSDVMSEVACRKTVCRVSFRALDLENKVLAPLYEKLGDEFGTQLALDDGSTHDAEHATLYVLRKGYTLEAPTP